MAKSSLAEAKAFHPRAGLAALLLAAALAAWAGRSPALEPPKPAAPPASPQGPAAAAPSTPQSREDQPVEKAFKNIKVLNGMPASQMLPVMHIMRASLGVRCDFCHVAENDKYDLDTKRAKETARRMIRMVLAINRDNFEGRPEVTCNTCHRGQEHPVRVPPIGQGLFADTTRGEPEEATREALPEAAAVLDRYIAALGGRAALESVASRVSRGTLLRPKVVDSGTPKARAVNRGQEDPLEIIQQAPNKLTVILGPPAQQIVQSFDGASGTIKTPRGERPMTPQEIARAAANAGLHKELALRDRAAKARVVGKDQIDGRDVILVRVPADDGSPALLAFDAQGGLLRRQTVYRPTLLGPDPEQTDYEDYRDVGGVKVPFLVKTSFLDDNHLGTTRKLTEVRHNALPKERK
ncbi:MAG TPA: c-type cytochrome [Thermoanaerobaculia bacterium]